MSFCHISSYIAELSEKNITHSLTIFIDFFFTFNGHYVKSLKTSDAHHKHVKKQSFQFQMPLNNQTRSLVSYNETKIQVWGCRGCSVI